jgi:hypothetical protein
MRRSWPVLAAVTLCLLLAGCAGGGRAATPPGVPPPAGDPLGLIGSWTVTDAGEEPGAVLRLSADGVILFRACGFASGSWRADPDGLFVAELSSAHTGCPAPDGSNPAWLYAARSFRADGDRREILDARGTVLARLRPGATPTPGPDLASEEAAPPVVTDAARRAFGPSRPLPAGLAPAAPDALVGRWTPVRTPEGAPQRALVELRGDGGWTASDGCNGTSGRWVVGPRGALLAVAGPATLIGCDGVNVAWWLSTARRAGLDGSILVLLDAHGAETGRLQRSG